jgi:hypothetical protein
VVAVAMVLASAGSLGWWYFTDQKPDWRAAAAQVASEAQPGDAVVVLPGYFRTQLDYYLRNAPDATARIAPAYPSVPWGQMGDWDQIVRGYLQIEPRAEELARYPRVWLLVPRVVPDPEPRIPELLRSLGARGYRESVRQCADVEVRLLIRE